VDRDPYRHVPFDFKERSKLWRLSAENLISESAPFIYISVENLTFAERSILQMERALAWQHEGCPDPHEPWLLKECAAQSILWVCGLFEVTRTLRAAKIRKYPALDDLHKKLSVLRIPLAKHEVSGRRLRHYPTSVWSETGRIGWHAFNPAANSLEVYFRSDLADEFLAITGTAKAS
jgi:hypothetical protein